MATNDFPMQRRTWLQASAVACLFMVSAPSQAQTPQSPAIQRLPSAASLPDELKAALARKQSLVVMVSLDGCAYCRIARNSHLLPMLRAGQSIVQVDMRSAAPIRDLQGRMTTHDELTRRWNVTIAPTLLFFGPGGIETAERMEGAYQPDFYGPYLEQRLEDAAKKL